MYMKNYEVAGFGEFLLDLKLKGKQSRMRTRFIRLLQDQLNLVNEERNSLLDDYAAKDENGDFITEMIDGKESIVLENGEEYNLEMTKLMNEFFIIEETQERELMLNEVRNIVLECDLEFSGAEAVAYDRWCEIVEGDI